MTAASPPYKQPQRSESESTHTLIFYRPSKLIWYLQFLLQLPPHAFIAHTHRNTASPSGLDEYQYGRPVKRVARVFYCTVDSVIKMSIYYLCEVVSASSPRGLFRIAAIGWVSVQLPTQAIRKIYAKCTKYPTLTTQVNQWQCSKRFVWKEFVKEWG